MRRKTNQRTAVRGQKHVVAANEIASRIQNYCRRRVPDCRVVTVLDGADGGLDLCVGRRGGSRADQLWVRDLDVGTMTDRESVDRLAEVIRVWIEPSERELREPSRMLRQGGEI